MSIVLHMTAWWHVHTFASYYSTSIIENIRTLFLKITIRYFFNVNVFFSDKDTVQIKYNVSGDLYETYTYFEYTYVHTLYTCI